MTKQKESLLLAFNKGYRISKEGLIVNPSGILLKGTIIKNIKRPDYRSLSIKLEGKKVPLKVHRLQAYQKFGEKIFEEGIVVRHKNGNSLDNSWDNILIGTASENMLDIPKEDRRNNASHPKHDHISIISDYKSGLNYQEIMLKYNISSKGTVSYIINKSMKNT